MNKIIKKNFNNIFYYYYNYNLFFFDTIIFFNKLLIVLTLLGISFIEPYYVNNLSLIIRMYICIFLIIRFNPFINLIPNHKFTKLDKKVAFTSGLIIILSDSNLINYIKDLLMKIYLTTKIYIT